MTEEHDRKLPEQEDLRQQPEGPVGEESRGRSRVHLKDSRASRPVGTSLLFAAAVCATLGLLSVDLSLGARALAPRLGWILFVGAVGFQLLRSGRTSRWRAALFIAMAWGFLWQLKRSAPPAPGALEAPYCHIAIVSSILNPLYSHYLALRSGHWASWGPLSLGLLWLVVTLALGQAWCSWGCFYGGLDEGFSRLASKPLLRVDRLPARLRELPAAVLMVSILLSLTSALPVFCLWVCPLKLSAGFLDPDGLARKIQLTLFIGTGAAALVLGPLLLKKRIFCGLVCPFGAWQAFWGNLNPFRVTIRPRACTQCEACLKACPVFAIEPEGLARHEVGPYCNRCGECVDACPTGAIAYTLPGDRERDARPVFLFCALVMAGAVGGLFLP